MTLAYLDPGSGSLIASALVGGVAAAGVAAKQARARLGGFGRKKKRADAPTVDDGAATEAAPAGPTVAAPDATSTDDAAPADEPTTVSSDT